MEGFDSDMTRTLTAQEFEPYFSTDWSQTAVNASSIPPFMPRFSSPSQQFSFNADEYLWYDLDKDGALGPYELALYLASLSRSSDATQPMPSIDWDLWAADGALFLLGQADADLSGAVPMTGTW